MDRFSIKPTFSRTFTEDEKMGYLARGGYKGGVKTAEGLWRIIGPQSRSYGLEFWFANILSLSF